MALEPQKLNIAINDRDRISALLYASAKKGRAAVTVILGHGAGGNQLSSFMRMVAVALAARGIDVLTFNFLYMEQGRKVPDPAPKLESCYRAVIEAASKDKRLKRNRILIGGKSMGGRIASQVAASSPVPVSGLVFLGYPLHPPGKPEQLRDKHLTGVQAPMLFVQGSRDAFGTADEIRSLIKRLKLPAKLYEVEGGDHSLKAPKSLGMSQEQVFEGVLNEIARWAGELKR